MQAETIVYKIVDSNVPVDLSIPIQPLSSLDQADGFIHLSTKQQLHGTLKRFFQSYTQVTLLKINLNLLEDPNLLKWESPKDHSENDENKFPHIYGPLRSSYIVDHFVVYKSTDADNTWLL
ncbi:hypothetical protein AYI69_g2164 [Smittium culicis]|uniref:DUF952 domain-containing protein n=1 Tax=Smittium culicis TaxID=133412 RepID=A0A1R1YN92_9FUNG|nr:hypothetical protein AYI69_g2164 [Smittium culicis]